MLGDFNIALTQKLERKLMDSPKNRAIVGDIAEGLTRCKISREYSNGLRIKKLHHSKRVIFEVRINRADRLLFTVFSSWDSESFVSQPMIILGDIVKHDNVNRVMKNRKKWDPLHIFDRQENGAIIYEGNNFEKIEEELVEAIQDIEKDDTVDGSRYYTFNNLKQLKEWSDFNERDTNFKKLLRYYTN